MAKKAPAASEELEIEIDEIDDDLEVDDDLEGDLDGDDDLDGDVVDDDDDDDLGEAPVVAKTAGDEEDDEIPDADDVEASLDVILKERLVVEDEIEDDEVVDNDDRGEGNERVLPKQADEFVCNGCFLVKNTSQLADKKKGLCQDCV